MLDLEVIADSSDPGSLIDALLSDHDSAVYASKSNETRVGPGKEFGRCRDTKLGNAILRNLPHENFALLRTAVVAPRPFSVLDP